MNAPVESPLPSDPSGPPPGSPGDTSPAGPKKFRLGKVLLVVIPVAILAILAVAVAGLVDVDTVWGNLTRPAMVPATGQLTFQGQPLLKAQITTRPVSSWGKSALGWTDDAGSFSLQTDIRGAFAEGVTVGEHLVVVTAHGTSNGPGAPPLLTPQIYASMATSPLRITIGRNPEQNHFQIVLEGEPPTRPNGRGGSMGSPKGKRREPPPPGPPAEATTGNSVTSDEK